jgi:hypothetical protein
MILSLGATLYCFPAISTTAYIPVSSGANERKLNGLQI